MRRRLFGLSIAFMLAGASTGATADRASAAGEMTFRTARIGDSGFCGAERCPTVIAARGQITNGTPGRFLDFIERNAGTRDFHAVVFLDSPGGRVVAAMEFGTLLRKIGAAAVVARLYPNGAGGSVITNAECFSACVYALMGAAKRVVPTASRIGIHRMFVFEQGVDAAGSPSMRQRRFDSGDMTSFLMGYSAEMGVDPGLITAAERVPSDHLKILSRGEIRKWHLGVSKF